jgi:hypothetical protein
MNVIQSYELKKTRNTKIWLNHAGLRVYVI